MILKGAALNKINPKKLLNSKWTAVEPKKREKHFMVTEVEFDEEGAAVTQLFRTAPILTQSKAL